MMDVQIMRYIVDDVEQGNLPLVAEAAARRWYAPDEVISLAYRRSSANFLFTFTHLGEPRYLRLAHATARQVPAIAAELAFVRHVANTGLFIAQPLPSRSGVLIEEVDSQGQRYLAVLFAGLRGRELELEDLDEAHYRAWGSALAVVHRASQTCAPHPVRSSWRDKLHGALRTLPTGETALTHVLTAGGQWLDALTPPPQDYGLIHGDFELDNLIWNGAQVQALDFDDATYAWYAVDFAAALQDVWAAASEQREKGLRWFLEGYAAIRPLPKEVQAALPRLMTLVLALKLAQTLQAYASTTDENSPAWLAEMHANHRRWLQVKRGQLAWE